MKKKIIIFEHQLDGHGEHNRVKEEFEFDLDAPDEDIRQSYEDWVWEIIGDSFTWYEKEDEDE